MLSTVWCHLLQILKQILNMANKGNDFTERVMLTGNEHHLTFVALIQESLTRLQNIFVYNFEFFFFKCTDFISTEGNI